MSTKTIIFTKFSSFWLVLMCFLMWSYELHQVTGKNSWKNVAMAFYHAFYYENWAKIWEIPLFSQKREYLRITQTTKAFYPKVLETWNLAKL